VLKKILKPGGNTQEKGRIIAHGGERGEKNLTLHERERSKGMSTTLILSSEGDEYKPKKDGSKISRSKG